MNMPAEPLNTPEEAMAFIAAGDPEMDSEWFWRRLGVSGEAFAVIALHIAIPFSVDPNVVALCLEQGARLALRNDPVLLAMQKEVR